MKNFYEATDTRSALELDINLRVKPVGQVPAQIKINDVEWVTDIASEQTFVHKVKLNDPVSVQIQIQRTHPNALEIVLMIDGYEVLPKHQHHANPPTCYLDNNNVWRFTIDNFYLWLHENTGQGWII